MPTFFLSLPNQTLKMRTKLIHIPGAWSYPHTRQACPRNTQACSIFWYDSFATKLWNDFRIAANAMIITMLVCFYLFVFQYFKFNSIFVIILFSSAKIQLFHSPPHSNSNSPSPCAICLAFNYFVKQSPQKSAFRSTQSIEVLLLVCFSRSRR